MQRLRRVDVPSDTVVCARFLIGMLVARRFADGTLASGRIVETEAYASGDPASHAYRGPTPRNRSMFGDKLHAYVYFIYGTAYCLNITCEGPGVGAAVLIRSLEPLEGLARMRANRGGAVADRDLLRGPGRLCRALEIDRRFDGRDLETDRDLWLAADGSAAVVGTSERIGLTRAADVPHRFYARGSAFVSGRRSLSPDH